MTTWKNRELINLGWTKTKENFWSLVGLVFLAFVAGEFGREAHIEFLVNILTAFVLASVFLRIARGEKFDWKKVFDNLSWAKFLHYFFATIIVTIFVVVGLAFLVVPGIIIAIALSFTAYLIIDENKNMPWKSWKFWEAIKKSYQMTKGHKWRIFLLVLVLSGINILGFLALFVGLLVTIPLSGIAMSALYEKFKNKSEAVA